MNTEDFQDSYDTIKGENSNFLPLENYDIYFHGDERLISLHRIDNKYLGHSPHVRTFINERGIKRGQFLNLVFYQPQGSDK